MNAVQSFDYIIVGAGSAGCVLASRLSADPRCSVLLIEAGGEDRSRFIDMPKAVGRLLRDPRFAWHFPIEQPRIDGAAASEVWVRGRTLGGSSSINGMVHTRGNPGDYEEWNRLAGPHWGWADIRRAFMAIEAHELGAGGGRGTAGPLPVAPCRIRDRLTERMLAAGEEMGLPRRQDINGENQEGIGYYNFNIRNGRRVSAARAWLDPARSRPNLHIVTQTQVARVLFDGHRAIGVAVRSDGQALSYHCRGEVILAAGTIMSPHILQHSGIGPGNVLRHAGVPVLVDSPDVGMKLREHFGISLPYRLIGARGLNWRLRGAGLLASIAQYYLTRAGVLASGPYEVGGFVRTDPRLARPNAQIYLSAFALRRDPHGMPMANHAVEESPGLTMTGYMLHGTSEGNVMIRAPDPAVLPYIRPNWLSTAADQQGMIDLVRYMRRFLATRALEPVVGAEISPGLNVRDDADILDAVRRFAHCGLHAVGTCRMGNDAAAVLDSQLRVRGVSGLRVIDCAAMPAPITGNTSAPAQALAWRATELMRR